MSFAVTRVEENQDGFTWLDQGPKTLGDRGGRRISFKQADAPAQRMLFYGRSILGSDFDVYTNDSAAPEDFAKARVENQRPAVGHPGLDDHVRSNAINALLDTDQVLRQLDPRPPEP